ncbi:hypothetical protein [Bacillus horti]|uniref:Membrane protein n=1 Tax=Caldalkalibacillus horti TaxID=77523 RepID=A0ABT9VU86_9BACI|nr:hypothetical protein [Bacillus horti]MDQ0164547.1 putative membrane protein [Bacillus horti]
MKGNQALAIGIKLIGCVTVVYALITLIYGVYNIVLSSNHGMVEEILFAQRFSIFVGGLAVPVVIGALGFYLLAAGEKVAKRFSKDWSFENENMYRQTFSAALKLVGVAMVVYCLFPLSTALTEIIYIQTLSSSSGAIYSTDQQLFSFWKNAVPGLVYLLGGLYFTFRGKGLVSLAFRGENRE